MSKNHSISEESIKARAYDIWKTRQRTGKDGSPETDWNEAVELLNRGNQNVCCRKFWFVCNLASLFVDSNTRNFALDVVKTAISAFGLLATVIAGFGLILNYRDSLERGERERERLITDRFSTAVEQLGHREEAVRLGGIYSLERIAKDSSKDYWTVMEVLTSYVRKKSPFSLSMGPDKVPDVSFDVQAALTVIGRRTSEQEEYRQIIDLEATNLKGAKLENAKFQNANLKHANLQNTNFVRANLQNAQLENARLQGATLLEADLEIAKLTGAELHNANLTGAKLPQAWLPDAKLLKAVLLGAKLQNSFLWKANFSGANLTDANLSEANLSEANFTEAKLNGAVLIKADLSEANLRKAILNNTNFRQANLRDADFRDNILVGNLRLLTPTQVKSACFWEQAKFDEEFQKQLESSLPVEGVDCSRWE